MTRAVVASLCVLFTLIAVLSCSTEVKEETGTEVGTGIKIEKKSRISAGAGEKSAIKRKWNEFYLTMSEQEFLKILGNSVTTAPEEKGSLERKYFKRSAEKDSPSQIWSFFEEKLYMYADIYDCGDKNAAGAKRELFCKKAAGTYGETAEESFLHCSWSSGQTLMIIHQNDKYVSVGLVDIELQDKRTRAMEEADPEF